MIIAEIGSIHDGSLGNALKIIDVASSCGSNYVKFQYHIAKEETLKDAPSPYYFKDESRYEYFERIEFSLTEWAKILKKCKVKKIKFMCSVFSIKSLENLVKLGVKNIKIPSGEITNLKLIKKLNDFPNLKLFISTGMSNWKEIDMALSILKNKNITLMQCTSLYPCPANKVGINIISQMKKKYGKKYSIGFSDHTIGNEAAILALSYGAKYFEKHLTFSNHMYGSDAKFALEPEKFRDYINIINNSKIILENKVNKNNLSYLKKMKNVFEKKIIINKSIKKGSIILERDISFLKAKMGISASDVKKVVGKKTIKNLKENTVLKYTHLLRFI
jgi:N,N'-diacetyllegionaminate synthase